MRLSPLLLGLLALAASPAAAATWTGASGDQVYSNPGNWDAAPSPGAAVSIPSGVVVANSPDPWGGTGQFRAAGSVDLEILPGGSILATSTAGGTHLVGQGAGSSSTVVNQGLARHGNSSGLGLGEGSGASVLYRIDGGMLDCFRGNLRIPSGNNAVQAEFRVRGGGSFHIRESRPVDGRDVALRVGNTNASTAARLAIEGPGGQRWVGRTSNTESGGNYYQHANGVLEVAIAAGGIEPVRVHAGDAGSGNVAFEAGATLEVRALDGVDSGTYVVLSWQGSLEDGGLVLGDAPADTTFALDPVAKVLTVTLGDDGSEPPPLFVHPGGLFKMSDLERMRYQVQAQVDPWHASYLELRTQNHARHDYTVRGDPSWTSVGRDPAIRRAEFESDALAAYLNALMWAITQDSRHAEKSVQILNTWSNLTDVRGGGTEALNAGLFAWKLVEAAEIIKHTYPGWSPADIARFSAMLVHPGYSHTGVPPSVSNTNGGFYWRIFNGDPGRHGNQDLIAWRAMATMGVFLDNERMYDRAINYFKGLPARADDIPYVAGPSTSGAMITDNEFFTAFQQVRQNTVPNWGYNGVMHHYIWESGQNQESSRDQPHAFFGLGSIMGIAEVAWNQGDPVWNSHDNRIKLGVEYASRYNTSFIASFPDQPEPWEPGPGEFIQRTDRTGRWFSKKINPHFESDFVRVGRGDFPGKRPIFEQAVAHFGVRMGFPEEEHLWTLRGREVSIQQSGYETTGWSLDHPGWGALCFRRPPGCAGDPVQGFHSNGIPIFGIHVLPSVVPAEDFDFFPGGGQGRTHHDTTPGNSGGAYRDDAGVDIAAIGDGAYAIVDIHDGEWVSYTVFVPEARAHSIRLRYSAPTAGGRASVHLGGAQAASNIDLPPTGGNGEWEEAVLAPSAALDAGVQAMRLVFSGSLEGVQIDSIIIGEEMAGLDWIGMR